MKTKFKLASIGLALVASAFLFFGCNKSTLEPGGAYAQTNQVPDLVFFQIDSAFDLAYSAIDAAFKFEFDNRPMLWTISPNIKHTLDSIRPQAVVARDKYLAARAIYIANPVPANLTALQTVLAELQRLSASATAVLPKP